MPANHQVHYRVVIVGAGVAGLAAADSLLDSNEFAAHEVCVLEGSDRIGGRVETRQFSVKLPMKVEIGAAWIHGMQDNPFADLANTFAIECQEVSARNTSLHPSSCIGFQLYDGTVQLSDEVVEETWAWQDLLLQKLHELAHASDSWAVGEPLSEVIDHLLDSDEQFRQLVGGAPDGRKRLEFCVRELEAYFGLTAPELQVDSFVEIDLFE
jgi:polyamine oxidase